MLGKVPLAPKRNTNKAILVIIKLKDLVVDMQLRRKMSYHRVLVKEFYKIQCLKVRRVKSSRPRRFLRRYTQQKWDK